ncbi:hypothetical protein [Carnobacterium jeotgali]
MKKSYLLIYTALLFALVGCNNKVNENVFIKGNEFYSGSTKENLEKDVEHNRPSKLIVAGDSHYISSSMLETEVENVIHEVIQARDYIQKDDYKGHPQYDLIERNLSGDKIYKVISVRRGDYYYLVSLNLISDAEININNENSLVSAATFYNLKVNTPNDVVSTDYYYEVLRKIVIEE